MDFLISGAKKTFIHLQNSFIMAPIVRYFDPERHIWIETDALEYTIGKVLSEITLDQPFSNHMIYENLDPISKSKIGQWHLIAFFSQKIILTQRWYKTHNQKLLPIVEVFKTWRHYLEGCKYEIFVLIDHNKFR